MQELREFILDQPPGTYNSFTPTFEFKIQSRVKYISFLISFWLLNCIVQ